MTNSNQQQTPWQNWLFKQAPVIILLVGTNLAQYQYFTAQITKLDARVEKLQDRLIYLNIPYYDNSKKNTVNP
jgi:hypothetical protein